MDATVREALLVALTASMRRHKSWCGETNLQKSTYFLQEMTRVPAGFEFILYRHGPFSFDLRTELTAMRANDLLTLEPSLNYGPCFKPTDVGSALLESCKERVRQHKHAIEFIASWLGPCKVVDLERLGTAFYVIRTEPGKDEDEQAARVNDLKPHITLKSALTAIREVKQKQSMFCPVC